MFMSTFYNWNHTGFSRFVQAMNFLEHSVLDMVLWCAPDEHELPKHSQDCVTLCKQLKTCFTPCRFCGSVC